MSLAWLIFGNFAWRALAGLLWFGALFYTNFFNTQYILILYYPLFIQTFILKPSRTKKFGHYGSFIKLNLSSSAKWNVKTLKFFCIVPEICEFLPESMTIRFQMLMGTKRHQYGNFGISYYSYICSTKMTPCKDPDRRKETNIRFDTLNILCNTYWYQHILFVKVHAKVHNRN